MLSAQDLERVRDVAWLSGELHRSELRVEAAIGLVALVGDMVEVEADRRLLIDDVIAGWLALPSAVQEHYRSAAPATTTPLVGFGADYIEAVERTGASEHPRAAVLSCDEYERLTVTSWNRHIAEVQRRSAAGQPPPVAWLRQFPLSPGPVLPNRAGQRSDGGAESPAAYSTAARSAAAAGRER